MPYVLLPYNNENIKHKTNINSSSSSKNNGKKHVFLKMADYAPSCSVILLKSIFAPDCDFNFAQTFVDTTEHEKVLIRIVYIVVGTQHRYN